MSAKHPIISITGSSGAGTTSVKRIFEQIFRREKVEAAFIEGDAFHRYDRQAMKEKIAARRRSGQSQLHPLQRRGQRAREPRAGVRGLWPQGQRAGPAPTFTTRRRQSSTARRPARSPDWRDFPPSDLLFYEGLHGCAVTDKVDLARHRRPEDRRRAGHQSRMDPEDPSRPRHARLFDRSGDRRDPAAHAGLRPLHRPAVRADQHQLPARADRRHVEPVHRALDPDAGRIDAGHPLRQSARHRLPLPAVDDPRQLHVAGRTPSSCRATSSISPCS